MKRIIVIATALFSCALGANAQTYGGAGIEKEFHLFDFQLNTKRIEMGVTVGQVGSFTDYARFGMGAYVLVGGVYVDFLHAEPQHKHTRTTGEYTWHDTSAFCINAGYQIPILSWLRIMPVAGYAQTNEGITDASTINLEYDNSDWFHTYTVTPGSRKHYFNYGGGLSIQPFKYVTFNVVATRYAIYGGIGVDLIAVAGRLK